METCRPICVSSYSIARACVRVKSALFQVNEIHKKNKKTNQFPGSQRPQSVALRPQYLANRNGSGSDCFHIRAGGRDKGNPVGVASWARARGVAALAALAT